MRSPTRYRRRERDLVFPFVVLVWLAIWALWPSTRMATVAPRIPSDMRVRYVETPLPVAGNGDDAFLRLGGPDMPTLMAEVSMMMPPRPLLPDPRFLTGTAPPGRGAPVAPADLSLSRRAERALQQYQPQPAAFTPYQAGSGYVMRAAVDLADSLRAAGFSLPPGWLDSLRGGERPWDLTFEVACGSDGRTRDVFLLSGTLGSGVQSNVVKALYGATARPGTAAEGRLTLRWGRARADQAAPANGEKG